MRVIIYCIFTLLIVLTPNVMAMDLKAFVDKDSERLLTIFKELHQNPELPFMEIETAALVAKELKANGFEVHEGIGGTGVAGVLKNGDGGIVMFRADMDALPVLEETDLPYKSTKTMKDRDGVELPVMHACGHDAHVTWLIGIAKLFAENKDDWGELSFWLRNRLKN